MHLLVLGGRGRQLHLHLLALGRRRRLRDLGLLALLAAIEMLDRHMPLEESDGFESLAGDERLHQVAHGLQVERRKQRVVALVNLVPVSYDGLSLLESEDELAPADGEGVLVAERLHVGRRDAKGVKRVVLRETTQWLVLRFLLGFFCGFERQVQLLDLFLVLPSLVFGFLPVALLEVRDLLPDVFTLNLPFQVIELLCGGLVHPKARLVRETNVECRHVDSVVAVLCLEDEQQLPRVFVLVLLGAPHDLPVNLRLDLHYVHGRLEVDALEWLELGRGDWGHRPGRPLGRVGLVDAVHPQTRQHVRPFVVVEVDLVPHRPQEGPHVLLDGLVGVE
mmetsp:Transcript_31812/g.78914  ORF Transcript_31812/g.78914 Transcript_31812/m.78914 type:complete len:335 (-) Transcript_31812:614-1618(-)